MNHETWIDSEIFLGKGHRRKNHSKEDHGSGCGEGACRIQSRRSREQRQNLLLPSSQEYTVYGTSWCPFCRRAKILLTEEHVPFSFVDLDIFGLGPNNTRNYFVENNMIPENHKTIPTIFNNGKFIGGYTDLVNILKSEGKAPNELLQIVTQKSGESHVDFDKGLTHATLSLSSSWTTTDEYLLSTQDNATLHLSLNIKNLAHQKLYIYLVAEPPNDDFLVARRREQLHEVGTGGVVAVWREEGTEIGGEVVKVEESRFLRKKVVWMVEKEKGEVEIGFPDRLFVKEVVLSDGEDGSGLEEMELVFDKDIKVYVVYLTTEPTKKFT